MTTDQILKGVSAAAAHLCSDDKAMYDYMVKTQRRASSDRSLGEILGALTVCLRDDLLAEEAKKNGTSVQKKALERIAKNRSPVKKGFMCGTFRTKDGSRAVCDGFRVVRITDPAVVMPADAAEASNDPLDVTAAYDSGVSISPCVNIPRVSELRAMIREARAQHKGAPGKKSSFSAIYRLDGKSGRSAYVNAEFLVDMQEALPGATIMVSGRNAAQFYAADGDGLLCGVKQSALSSYHALNF